MSNYKLKMFRCVECGVGDKCHLQISLRPNRTNVIPHRILLFFLNVVPMSLCESFNSSAGNGIQAMQLSYWNCITRHKLRFQCRKCACKRWFVNTFHAFWHRAKLSHCKRKVEKQNWFGINALCKCLTYLFGWICFMLVLLCLGSHVCVCVCFVRAHNMLRVEYFALHKWWCPLNELIIEMHIYYATFASCYYTFFNIIHMNHVYICVFVCVLCSLWFSYLCRWILCTNNIGRTLIETANDKQFSNYFYACQQFQTTNTVIVMITS